MIKVEATGEIQKDKLSIRLTEGFGWNITVIPLFENSEVKEEHFPQQPGIFTLVINYQKLTYSEIVLYKSKPKLEELEFSFYKEHDRIFCRIKSACAIELNKEIVLNRLDEELQKILGGNN